MSNDRLNVKVVSNQNSVELTKSENKVVVTDKKQDTAVNVTQKETAVVTIVSKGPKGDKGDTGDIGTTITNQIATGSITASVNIGADTFRVQSGLSTFLYISSSGNIGIGTTSPTLGLLQLNTSAVEANPNLYINASGVGTTASITVRSNNGASVITQKTYNPIGGSDSLNFIQLLDGDSTSTTNQPIGRIIFSSNDTDTTGSGTTKAFIEAVSEDATPDAFLAFGTNQSGSLVTERMRITSTGNVGIGTTSPTNTLQVVGGITTISITGSLFGTASVAVNAQTASFLPIGTYNITSSQAINAQTASFLPIGTYSITSSWAQSASNAVTAQTASFLSGAFIQNGNSFGTTAVLGTNDTNNLELETNNTTRVFISSSGNVGIGTSSPTERLHVDGNLLVTGRITAEEFHTEFVSASIIYQSGSTQFGNSSDDTHIFTGSLYVTASLAQFSNEVRTGFLSSSYIDINTTAGITQPIEGRLSWDNIDGTLDIGLKGGNIELQVGQEEVVRVVNKTDANLLKSEYKVARIRRTDEGGAQGQRLAIKLSQANNDPNSVDTLGLVAENIDNNQEGYIITSGLVRDINTTGTLQGETWNDGDVLYLSPTTAGALTNIKPIAPNHTIIVGFVVYSHNNQGKIFVKVDNGYEIDELHNVRIITSSLSSGDLLVYSGSVWTNSKQLSGSYGLTGSLTTTGDITTQNLTVANITASENIRIGRTKSIGGNNLGTYNPILTYWNDGVSGAVQSASFGFRGSAYMDSIAYPDIFGFGTNDLRFFASTNGIATPTEIIRVVGSTGFVGIGESSPSAKLEIKGSGATSATTALRVENSNASASLVVLDNGNVGIGTTSPTAILNISGSTIITGSFNVNAGTTTPHIRGAALRVSELANGAAGTLTLGSVSNIYSDLGTFSFKGGITGTTEFMFLSGSRVGIGTNNPTNTLQVVGGVTATSFTGSLFGTSSWAQNALTASFLPIGTYNITASNAVNALTASFLPTGTYSITSSWAQNALTASFITPTGTNAFVQDGNSFGTTALLGTNDNQNLQFETSGSVRMHISSSGNIGIGTTAPTRKLYILSSEWDNTTGGGVIFENSSNVGASLTLKPSASVVSNGSNGWSMYAGATGAVVGDGNLGFWAHGTNEARFVIQRAGNVGIGETSPSAKLEIKGSGATSATTALRVENSSATARLTILDDGTSAFNTNHLYVSGSGLVGIGTTTPGVELDVIGSIRANSTMFNSTTQTQRIRINSTTHLAFQNTSSVEVARFDNAGNWGFGVTNPLAKLHISGAAADNLLRVESPTNANILFVTSSGRVGIGTTTPQSQLHITGANALFTLSPIHPLPTTGVASASFASSGSGADLKPYFWNGSSWNALY